MAKSTIKTESTVTAKEQPNEAVREIPQQLSLTEFCSRLSAKDKRVELIGAFENSERRNSRLKDTEEGFSARFQSFLKQPA